MLEKSIILLEGVDGAGKSTMAKLLQKLTGYEIVSGSNFELAEKGADYMFDFLRDLSNRQNIIVDRSWLSNYIYARLYNKNSMTDEQFEELTRLFDEKSIMIVLTASLDVLVERINTRGDEYIKTDEIQPILENYLKLSMEPKYVPTSHVFMNTDDGIDSVTVTSILNHCNVNRPERRV